MSAPVSIHCEIFGTWSVQTGLATPRQLFGFVNAGANNVTLLHMDGTVPDLAARVYCPGAANLLRTPAHTLTTEAIAMLNGRMSKDPEWLTNIAGLSRSDAQRLAAGVVRTLRSEMLIFLRWAMTLIRFERELYRNPGMDLNRLWWEYVQRFQKVTPPENRDRADRLIHLGLVRGLHGAVVVGCRERRNGHLDRRALRDRERQRRHDGPHECGSRHARRQQQHGLLHQ